MKAGPLDARAHWRRQRGFTLLEALLACGVFVIACVSLAHTMQVLGDAVADSRQEERVVRALRTLLEEQRYLRPIQQGEESLESPEPGVVFLKRVERFEGKNREGQSIDGLWNLSVVARWREGPTQRERKAETLCYDELPRY